jgi:hypothetical protein
VCDLKKRKAAGTPYGLPFRVYLSLKQCTLVTRSDVDSRRYFWFKIVALVEQIIRFFKLSIFEASAP